MTYPPSHLSAAYRVILDGQLAGAYACRAVGVPLSRMRVPGSNPHLATARGLVCAILRRKTTLSYPALGRLLGRHHAALIHMEKQIRPAALAAGLRRFEEITAGSSERDVHD